MKFARQNYTGLQSQFNNFFIQFVSLLVTLLLSVFLKLSFVGGWGWFYFEFLGDVFFKGIFFSALWWKFITICLTFTHSFTQFFCVFGGSVSVGRCAFFVVFFGGARTAE